jgi:type II secretory pathway pseudopilin PulG
MKKSFYLLGSVLAIALIGIVLLSGCTRSTGNTGGTAVNSNSTQSSSETQNTTTQQSTSSSAAKSNGGNKATVSDGVQTVATTLDRGIYKPIVVQVGIPVKWTITANDGDLNSCNNKMLIRSYGVEQKLLVGENVVEFTPTKAGTINYSCWMGMVGSTITVVDDINQ